MNKIELLAPAGNFEKMKYAFAYGADAVYLGGNHFSLRALSDNFSIEEMKKAVSYAHELDKRVYLTLNIFAHHEDMIKMEEYINEVCKIGLDAYIVSDIGIMSLINKIDKDAEIHVSTQANITNYHAAMAYVNLGAKRLILARELSLNEMKKMRENIPNEVELEVFVHGAMCISYSGRCLLSNYMTYRDSNRGLCAQPCRWKYKLVEEKRPDEEYEILEDERGTYILNSKDLCLIRYLDKLKEAGIDSFKIEGRMKSVFYVSTIVRAYRKAIDALYNGESFNEEWVKEVKKVSHRDFTTGFLFGKPDSENSTNFESSAYIRSYQFIGIVKGYLEDKNLLWVEQRNHFSVGEEIEIMMPDGEIENKKITKILDNHFESIERARHPQMNLYIPWDRPLSKYTILRKRIGE